MISEEITKRHREVVEAIVRLSLVAEGNPTSISRIYRAQRLCELKQEKALLEEQHPELKQ